MSQNIAQKRKPFALRAFAAFAVGAMALTGCSSTTEQTAAPAVSKIESDTFMTTHNLAGMDTRSIINQLDALPLAQRSKNLIASVRPDQLVLTDENKQQITMPIPEDQFYLSFAPFKTQTHDCHFHSLTTCVGEMQNEQLKVTVTDQKTGEKIIDQQMSTFDNGFVGLWLPRGIEATLSVEQNGLTATTLISTATAEDATCLTTMQLT